MSITVHYKNYKLGVLSFENNLYVYNSLKEEQEVLKNYDALITYNLRNSKNLKSEELFKFFKEEFLDNIVIREDLMNKLGERCKNDYEILENFSKLKVDKFKYWLSNN